MPDIKELIESALEWIGFGIETAAAAILIFGALSFLFTIVAHKLGQHESSALVFAQARRKLGIYILAGLEFLIVADILFTIVNRTLEDVIVLAIVASVRTLISVFLNRELKELKSEQKS